jgi:hypothetical protein
MFIAEKVFVDLMHYINVGKLLHVKQVKERWTNSWVSVVFSCGIPLVGNPTGVGCKSHFSCLFWPESPLSSTYMVYCYEDVMMLHTDKYFSIVFILIHIILKYFK